MKRPSGPVSRPRPAAATPATPTAATAQAERPTVQLTLDDAIKLALDRNLDMSVQRLNPQTFDFALASLRAAYRPTLNSTISQQSATTPSNSTLSGGQVGAGIVAGTTTYNGGLSQSLPWGGASVVAGVQQQPAVHDEHHRALRPVSTTPTGRPPTRSRCSATSGSTTRGSSW